ncbi:hypothetical protein LCGC14_0709530 [marine sediment metagenome]|uniref:Lipoprotein n=1 Tax=marine sediment metagenome TaxID=412755 RepID=A0A0F9T1C2_9ZZZZ
MTLSLQRIFLVVVLLISLAGCKATTQKSNDKVIAMAKVQHKCDQVHIVKEGSDWKVLDVCGTKRYYQYEIWCSECSPMWRELDTTQRRNR